jgi:hypothetical protein
MCVVRLTLFSHFKLSRKGCLLFILKPSETNLGAKIPFTAHKSRHLVCRQGMRLGIIYVLVTVEDVVKPRTKSCLSGAHWNSYQFLVGNKC